MVSEENEDMIEVCFGITILYQQIFNRTWSYHAQLILNCNQLHQYIISYTHY